MIAATLTYIDAALAEKQRKVKVVVFLWATLYNTNSMQHSIWLFKLHKNITTQTCFKIINLIFKELTVQNNSSHYQP